MARFISWGARPIDPAANTYVITHGLLNSADPPEAWIAEMAYNIRMRDPNANVVLTSWNTSNPLLYPFYAGQTSAVGGELARFLQGAGVNPQKTTLIGHSLGAQLSGAAGRDYQFLTGQKIGTIIGLDPAGPLFEQQIGNMFRLDPTDAARVVGIHTSKTFGYDLPVGHLDIYPNPNNIFQPGATNAIDNHGYATTLFNELLKGGSHPGLNLDLLFSNQTGTRAVSTTGEPLSIQNSFELLTNPIFAAIGVVWDVRVNRFRWTDSGKFAPREAIENLNRRRIEFGQQNIRAITGQFLQGKLPFEEWQRQMGEAIKSLHLEQALSGRGGIDQMVEKDYQTVQETIVEEFQFLQEFARDILAGNLSEKQIQARANMYAQRSRLSNEKAQQQNHKDKGFGLMVRSLGTVDRHCRECVDYANRGPQPIGSLPLPTEQCSCRANCKCSVRYIRSLSDVLSEVLR